MRHRILEKRQIFRAGLAAHLVRLGLKGHLLSFGEAGSFSRAMAAPMCSFTSALSSVLNETETLLAVEPLHSTSRHNKQSFRRRHAQLRTTSREAKSNLAMSLDKEPEGT